MILMACGTSFEELRPNSPTREAGISSEAQAAFVPSRPARRAINVGEEEYRAFMQRTVLGMSRLRAAGAPPAMFTVLPVVGEPLDPVKMALAQQYTAWCEGRGQIRDCVGVLQDGAYLDDSGKYKVAFDIALAARWDGFASELRQMVDPALVKSVILGALVFYMAAMVVPTGITQVAAAAFTVVLTAYLGAQIVHDLVFGWIELVKAVRSATTFGQLQAAGERYGNLIGANTARLLVMVITAAIAEGGLVARVMNLPKASQASVALALDTDGRLSLAGLGQVGGASVIEGGVAIQLAPAGAVAQQVVGVAMVVKGTASRTPSPCPERIAPGGRAPKHHIATNKNSESDARGGPWTQRFERIFRKAGMTLDDPANIIEVEGHRGPHPEEYHETVFRELTEATRGCRTMLQCRSALVNALQKLAGEIGTSGSDLNKLVTKC